MTAGPKPRPPLLRLKPATEAKPAKPQEPADTPPSWRPAGNVLELRAQLPDLLTAVPPVFSLEPPVPLELGVLGKLFLLVHPGMARTRVRRWLQAWCRRPLYLEALAAEGSMRHGLDGQPVEEVAERHRAFAQEELGTRHAARKPRQAEVAP
jgi:sRNA-binding protein